MVSFLKFKNKETLSFACTQDKKSFNFSLLPFSARGGPAFGGNFRQMRKGFTLIEVLIAASIVAFLLVIAFFAFEPQLSKGRDAKRKAHLVQIKVAVEDYYDDKNCYPPLLSCGADFDPYLNKIPCDPRGTSYAWEVPTDTTCPQWYKIYTKLEYEKDEAIAESGCGGGCGPAGSTEYNFGVSSENTTVGTGGGGGSSGVWGCRSGICVGLSSDRECQPSYASDVCDGTPSVEPCSDGPECVAPP